jgi:hypothetical protein
MACGFLNSAGTDLDSLFLVDNKNAGAIGFLTSSGQDLGNRFSAASTLGYNVGYKNAAGTDIGYLRGKLTAPTGTLLASFSISAYKDCYKEGDEGGCDIESSGVTGAVDWSVSGSTNVESIDYLLTYYRTGGCGSRVNHVQVTSGTTTSLSGKINYTTPAHMDSHPDHDGEDEMFVTLHLTLRNAVGSLSLAKSSSSVVVNTCSWAGGA